MKISYTNFISVKLYLFSNPPIQTCVLGAQKNRLIETYVLDEKIKKTVFQYALLSGCLFNNINLQIYLCFCEKMELGCIIKL